MNLEQTTAHLLREWEELNKNNIANTKVKDWYFETFCDPENGIGGEDIEAEICEDMNAELTFKELLNRMVKGEDFYEIINVNDSTPRERIFEGIADALDIDYDILYYSWLFDFEAGEESSKNQKYLPYLNKLKEISQRI